MTGYSSRRRGGLVSVPVMVILVAFALYMSAGALAEGQEQPSPEQAPGSSQPPDTGLEASEPAPVPGEPQATVPEQARSSQPAPPESSAPGGPQQTLEKNEAGAMAVEMPDTNVEFGGGFLCPGETYTGTLTFRVRSSDEWMFQLNKGTGMVGRQTGQVIPPPVVTLDARSASGVEASISTSDSGSQESLVCRGDGTGEGWVTVTVRYSLHVTWDMAPDTYALTQSCSVLQI